MIGEIDMSQEPGCFYEKRARRVVAKLQKKNANAIYTPPLGEKLLLPIATMVPGGAKVVRGIP